MIQILTAGDRTSELRKKGYVGRRLGPKQMTTDTAVRVTRMVVHDKSEFIPDTDRLPTDPGPAPLEQIPYVDYPEILVSEHERTEMPFRYVTDASNQPIMPAVSIRCQSSMPIATDASISRGWWI